MTDGIPEDYNDAVDLVESNDAGVVAQIIVDECVYKDDLRELIDQWRDDAKTGLEWDRDVHDAVMECADELEALLDE